MNQDQNFISREDFLKDALFILRETFEGSPAGEASQYLDRGVGLLSTLDRLSAAQVSTEVSGTTIAAHTEHAKFYCDRLCEFISGRTDAVNWEQSWLIDEVDEEEWSHLREAAGKSYRNVLQTFADTTDWDQGKIGQALAIISHTAYHLGAIRQMAKAVSGD